MTTEDKRTQRLQLLEDHIGRALQESQASGELQAAPSYGKPLAFGDGYDETPAELRMAMKVLKDAGVVPHEVTLMREAPNCSARSTCAVMRAHCLRFKNSWPGCSRTLRCAWSGCGSADRCSWSFCGFAFRRGTFLLTAAERGHACLDRHGSWPRASLPGPGPAAG
jgi:hypothetical protein